MWSPFLEFCLSVLFLYNENVARNVSLGIGVLRNEESLLSLVKESVIAYHAEHVLSFLWFIMYLISLIGTSILINKNYVLTKLLLIWGYSNILCITMRKITWKFLYEKPSIAYVAQSLMLRQLLKCLQKWQ